MNPPTRAQYLNVDYSHGLANEPQSLDPASRTGAPSHGCDCAFPWWWIVFGGAVGVGVGYALGRSQAPSALEPEL